MKSGGTQDGIILQGGVHYHDLWSETAFVSAPWPGDPPGHTEGEGGLLGAGVRVVVVVVGGNAQQPRTAAVERGGPTPGEEERKMKRMFFSRVKTKCVGGFFRVSIWH